MRIPKADTFRQLAAEKRWLRGETPGSFLAALGSHKAARQQTTIAKYIEKFLASPRLRSVVCMLEEHNRRGRSTPFLLGPLLFGVMRSIEARKDVHSRMPVLMRRPAEVRTFFRNASAKTRALAKLIQKGPQPSIALAAHDYMRQEFGLFLPFPVIQSSTGKAYIVPLDQLLKEAAVSFDEVAQKIAKRTKEPAAMELRRLAARRLVAAFRKQLKRPYHSHVATVVQELTDIVTDADDVKKIEKRSTA